MAASGMAFCSGPFRWRIFAFAEQLFAFIVDHVAAVTGVRPVHFLMAGNAKLVVGPFQAWLALVEQLLLFL